MRILSAVRFLRTIPVLVRLTSACYLLRAVLRSLRAQALRHTRLTRAMEERRGEERRGDHRELKCASALLLYEDLQLRGAAWGAFEQYCAR